MGTRYDQLLQSASRLRDDVTVGRDHLRDVHLALKQPSVTKTLTPAAIADRSRQAHAEVVSTLQPRVQEISGLVSKALAARTTKADALRNSRFAPAVQPVPTQPEWETDVGRERRARITRSNIQRELLEHAARTRWLLELPRASASRLAALALDAGLRGEGALLSMIGDELGMRKVDDIEVAKAKGALAKATATIQIPDWQQDDDALNELQQHHDAIQSAWREAYTGKTGTDVHDRVEASKELGEGGYLQHLEEQKVAQQQRAESLASKFVRIGPGDSTTDGGTPAAA